MQERQQTREPSAGGSWSLVQVSLCHLGQTADRRVVCGQVARAVVVGDVGTRPASLYAGPSRRAIGRVGMPSPGHLDGGVEWTRALRLLSRSGVSTLMLPGHFVPGSGIRCACGDLRCEAIKNAILFLIINQGV